jgi:hypothetical protein
MTPRPGRITRIVPVPVGRLRSFGGDTPEASARAEDEVRALLFEKEAA